MSFEMRPAARDDFNGIMEIVAFAQAFLRKQGVNQWQNGYPSAERITADIEDGLGHVLTRDGQVASYGVLTFGEEASYADIYGGAWESATPYGTLHRLATHPSARGTDATSRLLAHLEALCRQAGFCWMRSDTHRDNYPMRNFLDKCGFNKRGIIFIEAPGAGGNAGDERIAYEKCL